MEELMEDEVLLNKIDSFKVAHPQHKYEELSDEDIAELGTCIDGVGYKIEQVAKILGLSKQVCRIYATDFEDIIHIERTKGNHRIFSKQAIEQLRFLLKVKEEKGFTVEQTKSYVLYDYENHMAGNNDPDRMNTLLNIAFQEKLESFKNSLITAQTEQMRELAALLSEQNKYILSDNTRRLEEKIGKIEEKLIENEHLIRQNEQLKNQNEQLEKELEELKKRKKSIFSWKK